eukprot:TRINITY_DN3372_c0_g1_i2.p1 TRINITY_DN3372_c0_g1~~TRINITY_DN3372_c0_g1_i2.p1  ORF type:complete len:399 (+),score=79.45 TRINITY_DN3372_c0_g1_i2:49-1245(+)
MFTIYVDWSIDATAIPTVDVAGSDTINFVREKVAEELKVDPRSLTMFFDGDELDDMSMVVSETLLVEGSTVEVRPSRRFEAVRELEAMKLGTCHYGFYYSVLESNRLVETDEEKAQIAQYIIECDKDTAIGRYLWKAVEKGYAAVVRVLAPLRRGDIDYYCSQVRSPLHGAAAIGNTEIAGILLDNGACANHRENKAGETPLIEASRHGHEKVVRLLLDRGADIRHASSSGRTALFAAAEAGHKDVAELLVARGADVAAETENGETLLHAAGIGGNGDICDLLIAHGADVAASTSDDDVTPLHLASKHGNASAVRSLVSHGAYVHATTITGRTPLHEAAEAGHAEAAELLIASGANVNAADVNGDDPLSLASRNTKVNTANVTRLLIANGGRKKKGRR